jgi:hypothetical protein
MVMADAVRWEVVRYFEKVHQVPGEAPRAGGTCDKCSRCIRYVVTLKSTDGQVMDVGTDCAVTLEGGPELAAIRRAEREYEHECWLKSPEYARQQSEAAAREARRLERAARAEEEHAEQLKTIRSVLASANTSTYEKTVAEAAERQIVRGHGYTTFREEMGAEDFVTFQVAVFKAGVPASTYAGKPGDKVSFRGQLVAMIAVDTAYGLNIVNKFVSTDGQAFVWFSKAGSHSKKDLGKLFDVKGTVKAHKEYNGAKETTLLRCKLTKVEAGDDEAPGSREAA